MTKTIEVRKEKIEKQKGERGGGGCYKITCLSPGKFLFFPKHQHNSLLPKIVSHLDPEESMKEEAYNQPQWMH